MYENVPDIMSLKQAQEILQCGKNTILDYIHSGKLKAKKIGKGWKITKKNLIKFIEED